MSAGAAAAAARIKMIQEEEEIMTPYDPADVSSYEFKIIRSATAAFKNLAKLRAILDEEAKAGWELVEKFDNSRVRLRRLIEFRQKDELLEFDPYRITVGTSETAIVLWVLLAIFGGIGLAGLIAFLIVH